MANGYGWGAPKKVALSACLHMLWGTLNALMRCCMAPHGSRLAQLPAGCLLTRKTVALLMGEGVGE